MEKMITVSGACPCCHKDFAIHVFEIDFLKWQKGELVQRAFPYLSASEREAFITGMCDDCWNSLFKEED